MTVWDYERKHKKYPLDFGEFRKCTFVNAEFRSDSQLAGFYYLGLAEDGGNPLPIIIQAAKPHWFYQGLLKTSQQRYVQFADGRSELIILSSDAVGLRPVLDVLLEKK